LGFEFEPEPEPEQRAELLKEEREIADTIGSYSFSEPACSIHQSVWIVIVCGLLRLGTDAVTFHHAPHHAPLSPAKLIGRTITSEQSIEVLVKMDKSEVASIIVVTEIYEIEQVTLWQP
jgi:hypothetical protein